MRKVQHNSARKRKAVRPRKARSGHKKGLRRLGRVLREIVHKCLGIQGSVFELPRVKNKKGKHSEKEV